ncbi:hypothetical protein ILYODFUR_001757 [Ilyodon furcidens]|uniref:Uncharacterized protein n=2 Tax=Goodeidae TaxID=28758 RepID=A0ABV0TR34_9TELE
MITVECNATNIWSHSSVTRLHGKNRAKTNRTDGSLANTEHIAKVYCCCSISSSFNIGLVFIHFPPLCLPRLTSSRAFFSFFFTSPATLHSLSGDQWLNTAAVSTMRAR